jgi:hypothetical protein
MPYCDVTIKHEMFEVPAAVLMRKQVFWDMTPCQMGNSWRLLDPGDDGSISLGNVRNCSTRLNISEDLNFKILSLFLQ